MGIMTSLTDMLKRNKSLAVLNLANNGIRITREITEAADDFTKHRAARIVRLPQARQARFLRCATRSCVHAQQFPRHKPPTLTMIAYAARSLRGNYGGSTSPPLRSGPAHGTTPGGLVSKTL